ncbi:Mycobacterium terramassiliense ORFan [Mycobacterium terramassiliense]|uniref:Mycobacterium terramassiliense ORFan n=1 Tax=Mycobacterium terramassiliense TaxID=1841859 RepID=A0A2U3NJ55_9MYCO|nr:Mycobacterium terramassiliense ORFan [Mycobacterium terramassiliense]
MAATQVKPSRGNEPYTINVQRDGSIDVSRYSTKGRNNSLNFQTRQDIANVFEAICAALDNHILTKDT